MNSGRDFRASWAERRNTVHTPQRRADSHWNRRLYKKSPAITSSTTSGASCHSVLLFRDSGGEPHRSRERFLQNGEAAGIATCIAIE